jgi:hypothetical protein
VKAAQAGAMPRQRCGRVARPVGCRGHPRARAPGLLSRMILRDLLRVLGSSPIVAKVAT